MANDSFKHRLGKYNGALALYAFLAFMIGVAIGFSMPFWRTTQAPVEVDFDEKFENLLNRK